MEKIILQIPEDMRKLISDVMHVIMEKSGFDKPEVAKWTAYIENVNPEGNKGMFEAAIESIIEDREAARAEGREEGHTEGREKGREEGREEGRAEGREEGMEIAARNAIVEGVSLELIHKITGIDMVTLENMKGDRVAHG